MSTRESFYGSDKDARERAARLRKEAKRRKRKDARGPVRFGEVMEEAMPGAGVGAPIGGVTTGDDQGEVKGAER